MILLYHRILKITEKASPSEQEAVLHTEVDSKNFSFDHEILEARAYRRVQRMQVRSSDSGTNANPESSTQDLGLVTTANISNQHRHTKLYSLEMTRHRDDSLLSPKDSTQSNSNAAGEHFSVPAATAKQVQTNHSVPEITLNDFMPQYCHTTKSSSSKAHPRRLLLTPTEIRIIGQNIQAIPAGPIRPVLSSLTT